MNCPDINISQDEIEGEVTSTTEVGEASSFEAQSETFEPNPLSELVRYLNLATENTQTAVQFALPGDQAVLVSLCVQIQAVAKLFVDSAEAAAAAAAAEESSETLPLAEED